MNDLKWVINELVQSIEKYIEENDKYRMVAEQSSLATLEANADAEENTLGKSPASTISTNTISSPAAVPTTTVTANVTDASQTEGAEWSITQSPMLAAYNAAHYVFPSFFQLKKDKVNEAHTFLNSIITIRDSLEGVYDRITVENKLKDLKVLVDNEIEAEKFILEQHKHKPGSYDASLKIFKNILDWLLSSKNLDLICISLKYHTVTETIKRDKKMEFVPPAPAAKDTVEFLMRTILELQLDGARSDESALIPYERKLPEVQAADVVRYFSREIIHIEEMNVQYVAARNSEFVTLATGGRVVTESPVRQNHIYDVLGSLCYTASNINDTLSTYLSSNAFMTSTLNELKRRHADVNSKILERDKSSLAAKPSGNVTLKAAS